MAEGDEGTALERRRDMRIVQEGVTKKPSSFRAYAGRFMTTFLEKNLWEFGKGAVLNIITAAATVGFTVYLGTTAKGAIKGNLIAIAGTYTVIAAVFLIGHTLRTASQIYAEDQAEIDYLRKKIILSDLQTTIIRLTRGIRSFMAEHRDSPSDESREFSSWLTKFHVDYQERFADQLKEASIGLKRLGMGEAQTLEGWSNVGPNSAEGCLTLTEILLDFLMRVECKAADGREEMAPPHEAQFIRLQREVESLLAQLKKSESETRIYLAQIENQRERFLPLEGLLTPLQIEAFTIAKELRDFIEEMGECPLAKMPEPGQSMREHLQKLMESGGGPDRKWMYKLQHEYTEREFPQKIRALLYRAVEEINYPPPVATFESVEPPTEDQVRKLAQSIEMLVIHINRKQRNEVNLLS